MKLPDHLKPSNYGAESAADVGFFIVGAALGGIADGVLNFAGFADPLVIAGFGGAGALGLKKLLWDAPMEARRKKNAPSEKQIACQEIELEISLMQEGSTNAEHKRRVKFLEKAMESDLDAEAVRRLWITNR